MFRKKAIIGLLLILACQSCTKINDSNLGKTKASSESGSKLSVNTKSLQEAIDLAVQAIYKDNLIHEADYILMSVQQIPTTNKWIWRVTFKPKMFVPDDPSIGMHADGAEVLVNVDLTTKETKIMYGK